MPSTVTDRLQGVLTSTAIKPPCKAVATTAISLSGEQTVDGTACVSGDRVLVAISGGSVSNGIWVVDTGAWSRAKDFDGTRDVVQGTLVIKTDGEDSALWQVTTPNPIVIGQTSIEIEVLNLLFGPGGVFGDPGRSYRQVAFVLRNSGAGWNYINDVDHAPVGMDSGVGGVEVVTVLGVKVLRTHYSFAASRVLTLFGGNDETLAARGLEFGPSVGLEYSDWRLYMPMTCWVDKNAGIFSFGNIDPWLDPGGDTTVALTPTISDGSSFTITHLGGSADDVPVVSMITGNATASLDVAVTYGGNSVRVDFMEDMHGYVYYDGAAWQVQTPNSNKPTFNFAAGVLTVTHENIGDIYDTQITGVGGTLVVTAGTPSAVAITRATSFLVTFQDYAGATDATADTNMKFHYRRARKVRTVPPDGARVAVRRGPVLLDPDVVTSANGNIWAIGLLEV